MASKDLLLIGPLPRSRPEGVSMAFKTLVDGLGGLNNVVVNTNWLSVVKTPGRFNVTRAFESLGAILQALFRLPQARRAYLIISTSRLGFLRDAAIILFATLAGRKVICHLHGAGMRKFYLSSGRLQRLLIRSVYCRTSRIIVLGHGLKNQFRFLPDPERIVVVPNGLPSDLTPDRDSPRELSSPIRLLYLSNLSPTKGIIDLVESVAELRRSFDIELEICGAFVADVDQGSMRNKEAFEKQLDHRIRDLGLLQHVWLRGVVRGKDKADVLRRCHIFVLPTYHSTEAQPLSIIEAQAWGLPVVVTDYRAIRDIVVFGESAEACQKRDPGSITAAVTRIAESSAAYRAYSRASLRNYSSGFRFEYHIENMKKALLGPL